MMNIRKYSVARIALRWLDMTILPHDFLDMLKHLACVKFTLTVTDRCWFKSEDGLTIVTNKLLHSFLLIVLPLAHISALQFLVISYALTMLTLMTPNKIVN
jgi:hypothetical protein